MGGATDIQQQHDFAMIAPPRHTQTAGEQERVVRQTSGSQGYAANAYAPTQFQDDVDVAECALDEQLEQLQRHYATASRAVSRARFEVELLEKRDDVPDPVIAQAKRQRAAAETRCTRLLTAIEALEDRLENQ
jgi:ribosome-associated translation inhibitor RaiA